MPDTRGRSSLGGFLGDIFQPATARLPTPVILGNIKIIENVAGLAEIIEDFTGSITIVESPLGTIVFDFFEET